MAKFQHPDFGHTIEVLGDNRVEAFEERGYIRLDDEPVKPRTRTLKTDEKTDEKSDEKAPEGTAPAK